MEFFQSIAVTFHTHIALPQPEQYHRVFAPVSLHLLIHAGRRNIVALSLVASGQLLQRPERVGPQQTGLLVSCQSTVIIARLTVTEAEFLAEGGNVAVVRLLPSGTAEQRLVETKRLQIILLIKDKVRQLDKNTSVCKKDVVERRVIRQQKIASERIVLLPAISVQLEITVKILHITADKAERKCLYVLHLLRAGQGHVFPHLSGHSASHHLALGKRQRLKHKAKGILVRIAQVSVLQNESQHGKALLQRRRQFGMLRRKRIEPVCCGREKRKSLFQQLERTEKHIGPFPVHLRQLTHLTPQF